MTMKLKSMDQLRDMLLNAFDERIDTEKGERDGCDQFEDINHHQGRVDGVDTGRMIVEETLAKLEL